jgi:sodium/potassium-transporting ATPase subunit alpha
MRSIKSLIAQDATVVRGGTRQVIKAADLVVGDIVLMSMGERVPADLRIFEASSDLRFDRSLLTGERYAFFFHPSLKIADETPSEPIPGNLTATSDNPLETHNLALSSTFVTQGTCSGVVFAIGDKSTMGRIVAMSGETKFKMTPMQKYASLVSCHIALAHERFYPGKSGSSPRLFRRSPSVCSVFPLSFGGHGFGLPSLVI